MYRIFIVCSDENVCRWILKEPKDKMDPRIGNFKESDCCNTCKQPLENSKYQFNNVMLGRKAINI